MSRYLSSAARSLLQFIWKGAEPMRQYESVISDGVKQNPLLDGVDTIEIAGQEHNSPADPELRVSCKIFKNGVRLTSLHAYKDGTLVFSKKIYNEAQQKEDDPAK